MPKITILDIILILFDYYFAELILPKDEEYILLKLIFVKYLLNLFLRILFAQISQLPLYHFRLLRMFKSKLSNEVIIMLLDLY